MQVQPDTMTIVPGATVRIETPVQLRFDPRVPPSGGDVSTRWSLPHVPVPVRVQAALQLTGVTVGSCEARFDPQGAHEHRLRAGSGGVVRQSS